LETNSDFIIGSINKIVKTNNLYYLLDKQTKTIFIYDKTGISVKKISNTGQGPNEYIYIEDFFYTFAGLVRVSYIKNNTRVHKLSGIPFSNMIFSDNTLISWIYPYTLNDMERFQKIAVRNYSDTLLKHDNPVLLIYDLKN
jgi:hypothetical protein